MYTTKYSRNDGGHRSLPAVCSASFFVKGCTPRSVPVKSAPKEDGAMPNSNAREKAATTMAARTGGKWVREGARGRGK